MKNRYLQMILTALPLLLWAACDSELEQTTGEPLCFKLDSREAGTGTTITTYRMTLLTADGTSATYMAVTDDAGKTRLEPCKVEDDGTFIVADKASGFNGLAAGEYEVDIVSPAVPRDDDGYYTIDLADKFFYGRTSFTVTGGKEETINLGVTLNDTRARATVTVTPGTGMVPFTVSSIHFLGVGDDGEKIQYNPVAKTYTSTGTTGRAADVAGTYYTYLPAATYAHEQLKVKIDLSFHEGKHQKSITLPLTLTDKLTELEALKNYHFTITVNPVTVTISVAIAPWNTASAEGEITETPSYTIGTFTIGGWGTGGSSTGSIGNP